MNGQTSNRWASVDATLSQLQSQLDQQSQKLNQQAAELEETKGMLARAENELSVLRAWQQVVFDLNGC